MSRRLILPLLILGLLAPVLLLAACSSSPASVPSVAAAPNAFSGPVNGACYLDTPTTCRIHVSAWQPIVPDAGQKLLAFQLVAEPAGAGFGWLLYDFRTDVSNPPASSYAPSPVKQDFAAQCGGTYRLSLQAQDTGDVDFEAVGQTNPFRCPDALAATATATTTATATVTATATATPVATPTATATLVPGAGWRVYVPLVFSLGAASPGAEARGQQKEGG